MTTLSRCHNCRFGELVAADFNVRICRATPPTPMAFPHPKGIQIQMVWSQTGKDDWCGFWVGKAAPDGEMPVLGLASRLA